MDDFVRGQWNAVCQRCGFEFKSGRIRKEWTGLMVCFGPGTNNCHESRHPQDFVRGKKDQQSPPWVSPEPDDLDVSIGSGNEVSAEDL